MAKEYKLLSLPLPFVLSSWFRNPVSQRRKKMKLGIANGLLVMLLVMNFSSAVKSSEFQITADSSFQQCPAIYGNIVVWGDDRNGNWDIYEYDLSTENKFQITKDISDQEFPAIYGTIVVWEDYRKGNVDIFGCDLLTGKEGSYDTLDDIYGFNLKASEEFRVTTNDNDAELPAIYGDIVVWMDFKGGNSDIYGCDVSRLSNTEEEPSTRNEGEGTGKEGEKGICLGTFFIALALPWGIHQIQKPNKW
jgi:beta propeller repeat protein